MQSHYLSIFRISPCKDGCRPLSTSNSNAMFEKSFLSFYMKNKYVDLDDPDNLIKERHNKLIFHNTSEGGFVINMKLIRHEVVLGENYWLNLAFWDSPEIIKFYTFEIDEARSRPSNEFKIIIELGDEIKQYQRRYLSFFEIASTIGGIFWLLKVIFSFMNEIISSFIQKRNIKRYLMKADQHIKAVNYLLTSKITGREVQGVCTKILPQANKI